MKKEKKDQGVSDVVGTILLLGMAVALFSLLSIIVLSYPFNESTPDVNIIGLVDNGNIVLQHHGGETLTLDTQVIVRIADVTYTFSIEEYVEDLNDNNRWDIGESVIYMPSMDIKNLQIDLTVVDQISGSVIMDGRIQEGITSTNPFVKTLDATSITRVSAVLNMEYDFRGAWDGELRFIYKEETAATWLETDWETAAGAGSYAKLISGLTQWHTYVFKAQLKHGFDIIEGEEKTFTAASTPVVLTQDPTHISGGSATFNMEYDFKDYNSGDVRFIYRANWMSSWLSTAWKHKAGSGTFSNTVTGLSKGTTYIYKAQLKYNLIIVEGEEKTFIAGTPPTVTTEDASDIGSNEATLNMDYNLVDYNIGEVRFLYRAENKSKWQQTNWYAVSGSGSYSEIITGLSSDTNYVFVTQLKYELGIVNGGEKTFTTEV